MDYQNTLKYLYESVPMFQQVGKEAYKPGLETTQKLDEYFGHPHQQFKTIHIAGTNGKGSCSHIAIGRLPGRIIHLPAPGGLSRTHPRQWRNGARKIRS